MESIAKLDLRIRYAALGDLIGIGLYVAYVFVQTVINLPYFDLEAFVWGIGFTGVSFWHIGVAAIIVASLLVIATASLRGRIAPKYIFSNLFFTLIFLAAAPVILGGVFLISVITIATFAATTTPLISL